MTWKSSAVAALALAAIGLAGCDSGAPVPTGPRVFAFVDLSASIAPDQRSRWETEAARLIRSLDYGWSFALYPVHDQTLSAAPYFVAEIPQPSPEPGMDEVTRCKMARRAAREGASAAFRRAFSEAGRAPGTDLFSAVDRFGPDPSGRPTAAVFFSDMINSTAELNMERRPAVQRAPGELIRELASRHGWHGETLRGVQVYCVLNAVGSGQAGFDRRWQKRFYEHMFAALGGRLAVFDTHLDSWNLQPKGINHARY
jgi:hypothetical protein